MQDSPRIAVIGAGPSGITAAKNVIEAGLGDGLTLFEKSGDIGGNWVYREDGRHSSVYETTHIISSRYLSEYEDFPFPDETPDYPHHSHLHRYFNDYAEQFGVVPYIRFNTEVVHAERDGDGTWHLTIRNKGSERTETFDILMVANGHHWDPRLPEYPGEFAGEFIHSHAFKHNKPYEGKRVLVIGGGNSACDVAVECCRVAEKTCISMRRGHWFLPKFMFGLPGDVIYDRTRWIPAWLRQFMLKLNVILFAGTHERLGLQKPEYGILEGHPTLNSELFYFLGHGEIGPRRGIERLDGHTVHFTDGRSEDFDVIIAATGYKISFPFFDKSFINWEDSNYVPLWRRMFHADIPNLYFIGLFQPLGCIWPLSDYQAMLACEEIKGNYQRPVDLPAAIERERRRKHYAFIEAPRHSTEVDYSKFRMELLKELKKAGRNPRRKNAAAELQDRMAVV